MIVALSFLFKGESFSFVRGLWLLNLNNRKIFLWIFSGPALHLMFFGGDWKVSCFVAFGIFCEIYIFFQDLCLVYRRAFSARVFLQGNLNSLGLFSSCIRGVSLALVWSMITSCYFFVDLAFLSWYEKSDIVDVCLCRREGALVTWSKTLGLEITQVFSNWSR